MIDQAFATVLRHLRQTKGMSQEALAYQAGIHRTYVSQLERNLKSPSLQTVVKITNVLNISLTQLMTLVEQEQFKLEQTTK